MSTRMSPACPLPQVFSSLHFHIKAILCVAKAFSVWYRLRRVAASTRPSRKEVFQPHLPVRLPCYDLAPITSLTLGRPLRSRPSGTPGFHGLTGGVYKARERIHRIMADIRLLAIPASRSRVADSDPNCDRFCRFAPIRMVAAHCTGHCSTCVAQDVRAVMI